MICTSLLATPGAHMASFEPSLSSHGRDGHVTTHGLKGACGLSCFLKKRLNEIQSRYSIRIEFLAHDFVM